MSKQYHSNCSDSTIAFLAYVDLYLYDVGLPWMRSEQRARMKGCTNDKGWLKRLHERGLNYEELGLIEACVKVLNAVTAAYSSSPRSLITEKYIIGPRML